VTERVAIGIDAGGTVTVGACARSGGEPVFARGAPGNATAVGLAAAAAAIVATTRELAGAEPPGALFVAAAGAARPDVARELATALRAAFPACVVVVEDDLRVALRAGVPTGDGLVLVAGTGSVAYGERDGRVHRVGGLGWLAGDEGSAYALGLAAVRRLGRVLDGRERDDETTALAARLLGATGRDAYLAAVYAAPPDVARVASLAPAIVAFAGKGNRVATKLVQAAAGELAELVRRAASAAGFPPEAPPRVALAGGLLRENTLLSFLLETRLGSDLPGAALVRVRDEPAVVALRFAEALR